MKKIPKYQTGTPDGGIFSWQQVMQNVDPNHVPHFMQPRDSNQAQLSAISQEEINRQRRDKQQREAEQRRAEQLSKSQHMWNWTGPFMNTSSTNAQNAEARFNFNGDVTKSMIMTGSTVAAPITTAIGIGTSHIGSNLGGLIGQQFGNKEAGKIIGSMIGGYKGIKTAQNITRRGIETAMRTTPLYNPLPEIENMSASMWNGLNGGKKRLFHIGNFILTGIKTGPKGYYNSFAGYTPLDMTVTKPTFKQEINSFLHPKGLSYAYSGFLNNVGYTPIMSNKNDMIDAFLYNKTIDPSFGLIKTGHGENFGAHSKYVSDTYPNKANKIQVYEFDNDKAIPTMEIKKVNQWEDAPRGESFYDFSKDNNTNILNVGGHWKQTGTTNNGLSVVRREDIWKFQPDEYAKYWFNLRGYQESSPLTKWILRHGVKNVDKFGTPVITKTKWLPQ